MSTDRDVTRIVRSWLEEGATALPDRVLDTVLDQLPATPQRRAPWPVRRLLDMNIPTRIAVAAAAVVALAVIGLMAFPKGGGVAGPGPTASSTPIPTASATPSSPPLPFPTPGGSGIGLAPGSYAIAAGTLTPLRMTLTVPAGWSTTGDFVYKGAAPTKTQPSSDYGSVELTTWIVTHAYTDICHWTGHIAAGPTPDAFANLLQTQKGRAASTVTDVVLGGLAAKRVELTVPANLDVAKCDNGIIRFWPDPGPDETGGLCCSAPGSTDVVYVLSGGGKTFTVVVRHQANSTAADLAELDAVVASLSFAP